MKPGHRMAVGHLQVLGLAVAALLLVQGASQPAGAASTVLVPLNAAWRYLDNGTNAGTAWRAVAFNDGGWLSGPAQLGYGDGDEATTVGFGPNSSAKYITTYVRHTFNVASPQSYTSLALRVMRDDGAVVYLNGTEVFRSNMPTGTVSYTTLALTAIGGADESALHTAAVSPTLLLPGANVLAVEIHQSGGTSSDISFALELTANDGVNVIRGPYLQMGTPTSVMVRWRTDAVSDGRVRYGTSPDALTSTADSAGSANDHQVTLANLQPNTRYYYSVGTASATLAGDATYTFVTSPAPGTTKPTRIWVLGDSGTANANAAAVRDAYLNLTGARGTDLWLMLGDNAYNDGTDAEYQAAVFNMYPSVLRQAVLWPTLGNHDGHTADSANGTGPYYNIFTLPRSGEAGGVASGTEAYYSFDYGNIHFICLESFETNRSATGPMLTWLRNDIMATEKEWIVAFWHHPPYSKGSHNSDTETELIEMRANALPILEEGGVDLVLTGHSHTYERSFLLDGHYGSSTTFAPGHKVDGGSGRADGTGAYAKPGPLPQAHAGAVYAVAGSSGQISGGALNHPAMFISLNNLGSMVLDVDGNRLDAKFINETGAVLDYFTIVKSAPPSTPPAAPTGLAATATSPTAIALNWTDNAGDEQGFVVSRSTSGGPFVDLVTLAPNATSHTDTGLTPSTAYAYQLRAFNAAGSASSNVANATTPAEPPALPAAPSGLTGSSTRNSITLNWVDNANNETGFEIERSTNGTTFSPHGTVGANVRTFTDTGLSRKTYYWYRVRALNGTGASSFSNVVRIRTK